IISIRDRSSGVHEACTIAGPSLSRMVGGGAMSDISVSILAETADDGVASERLHERTFGPGRYAKSAYRLREQIDHIRELSFTAFPRGRAIMPGPVDPARLLIAELSEGAFDGVSGPVRPA